MKVNFGAGALINVKKEQLNINRKYLIIKQLEHTIYTIAWSIVVRVHILRVLNKHCRTTLLKTLS